MSTIWTPGGEYAPRREPEPPPPQQPPPGGYASDDGGPGPYGAYPGGEPTPEMLAEAARIRDEVLAAPATDLVANHAIGLFEVAALHLGAEQPNLEQAQLVIDAMAAIVDSLGPRLGRHERVLRDGLTQLQMAFVEAKSS